MGLCTSNSGLQIHRGAQRLDDDQCDAASFTIAATRVHRFAKDALCLLEQYPLYALPCLAHYNYAYHNILLDSSTYRVKAFIDWDDVHDMPFVIGVDFPEDMMLRVSPWTRTIIMKEGLRVYHLMSMARLLVRWTVLRI